MREKIAGRSLLCRRARRLILRRNENKQMKWTKVQRRHFPPKNTIDLKINKQNPLKKEEEDDAVVNSYHVSHVRRRIDRWML